MIHAFYREKNKHSKEIIMFSRSHKQTNFHLNNANMCSAHQKLTALGNNRKNLSYANYRWINFCQLEMRSNKQTINIHRSSKIRSLFEVYVRLGSAPHMYFVRWLSGTRRVIIKTRKQYSLPQKMVSTWIFFSFICCWIHKSNLYTAELRVTKRKCTPKHPIHDNHS